jgi:hypothetical protein
VETQFEAAGLGWWLRLCCVVLYLSVRSAKSQLKIDAG